MYIPEDEQSMADVRDTAETAASQPEPKPSKIQSDCQKLASKMRALKLDQPDSESFNDNKMIEIEFTEATEQSKI